MTEACTVCRPGALGFNNLHNFCYQLQTLQENSTSVLFQNFLGRVPPRVENSLSKNYSDRLNKMRK